VPAAVEELIWEVRRTFRALSVTADRAMERLGISAGDRAVLEFLSREDVPISLAALARKHNVSRQHIHQSVNRLRNAAWIEKVPDPADARTVLLCLSPAGQKFWNQIRVQDRAVLRRLSGLADPEQCRTAADTLHAIRTHLQKGLADY